ncbi:biotin-dependent carboxyltransferase family protein [Nocardioides piscis]|uniref:Biotin-dependent carboxyltransferase family protein n=1 Tax=Nocardioides piscis TaxID=2714938 RepID=A0A6G7YI64_9ACTN|nr:biotin-dependent carboxyltransferase family protein [Nocardioides piscis]QIK76307.1 biotin-dependent carboxyltransferase family protein [Nocardioides piscis]
MSLLVLAAGALTTIQDRGRFGHAHLGVPRAGALDAPAAALANRLVGNDPDAAVLETTLSGATFRTDHAATIAVTGAWCEVRVEGRQVAHTEAVSIRAGATVALGPARSGVRSYLAVGGGIDVRPVLGSRSTDTLAWIGPPRVQDGAVLPVGPHTGTPGPLDVGVWRRADRVLRVVPGPRADWIGADAWNGLDRATWTVDAASNRVGLRLQGRPLERCRHGELDSEGVVLGAVQLPPSGQPLVFLHDHPVTGGYPVIGVVVPDDLPICAQLRPGETVAMRVQSIAGIVAKDSAGSSTE